jgi:dihydropteroate synthase
MQQFKPFSLNIRGKLVEVNRPQVMGILNVTPDSFFAGSRTFDVDAVSARVAQMIEQGADMIDIGGCSTRPGYEAPSADEETRRVILGLQAVRAVAPDILVSVDTFRGSVAREAAAAGADIINDISAFTLDDDMYTATVDLKLPYILTHPSLSSLNSDTPTDQTMAVVLKDLAQIIARLRADGVADIIVDPGFGFGKTLNQNYQMMEALEAFDSLGCPLLVGISRKSMIFRLLNFTPAESLPGTIALNTVALEKGAAIIRVHDVAPARHCVEIVQQLRHCNDSI